MKKLTLAVVTVFVVVSALALAADPKASGQPGHSQVQGQQQGGSELAYQPVQFGSEQFNTKLMQAISACAPREDINASDIEKQK